MSKNSSEQNNDEQKILEENFLFKASNGMEKLNPEKKSKISDGARKNLQQAEQQQLTKQDRRQLKKQRKQEDRKSERCKQTTKKAGNVAMIILIVVGGIFGLGWFLSSRPSLPPTSMQNHSEDSPPARIVTQPIPDAIQRHMLEHADGKGDPGIIIQYNCDDFNCDPDLIQKLTALAEQYPDNVYLAPNSYDGKIILTKLGRREILDSFNEQAIKDFIK